MQNGGADDVDVLLKKAGNLDEVEDNAVGPASGSMMHGSCCQLPLMRGAIKLPCQNLVDLPEVIVNTTLNVLLNVRWEAGSKDNRLSAETRLI